MEIGIVAGTFGAGEVIIGQSSGATYTIRTVNTDDLVDPFADNDVIESNADDIIDFSSYEKGKKILKKTKPKITSK